MPNDELPDILYEILAAPETGAVTPTLPLDDPRRFIRTAATGTNSSAYGPVQITQTLAQDMLERNPELFDDYLKNFVTGFVSQGQKMLKNTEEGSIYDYGKPGELNHPVAREAYADMAKKIIGNIWEGVDGGSDEEKLAAFLERWRGVGPEKDPKYFQKALELFTQKKTAEPGKGPSRPESEDDFQDWYAQIAETLHLDPNPDSPLHFYNYRDAKAGGADAPGKVGGHFTSQFKKFGHPNLIVDGMNTKQGRPVKEGEVLANLLVNQMVSTANNDSDIMEMLRILYPEVFAAINSIE